MTILLATDIFGLSPWCLNLINHWQKLGAHVTVCSPYEHEMQFASEEDAYAHFSQLGGFAAYCDKIQQALGAKWQGQETLYIGFSAGGAALWKILSEESLVSTGHLIAFYPGQIRHHLDKSPNIDTSLVFPILEQHFDLSKVIEYLVTNPKLSLVQNQLMHGYANPNSKHYDQHASEALQGLLQKLEITKQKQAFIPALLTLKGEYTLQEPVLAWG